MISPPSFAPPLLPGDSLREKLPRVLITNDDGIEAPGLSMLEEIAHAFADDVWVVAPDHDQSGASQAITTTRPLFLLNKGGPRRWAVTGTPGDCVALAINHVMKDLPPTLILSGINDGANMGDDYTPSGTVGAVLVSLMLGVPGIALSQRYAKRNPAFLKTAQAWTHCALHHLIRQAWPKDTCLSVNFPDCSPEAIKGFRWSRHQERGNISGVVVEENKNPRGQSYYWLMVGHRCPPPPPGSEREALAAGYISLTALGLDRHVDVPYPDFVPTLTP